METINQINFGEYQALQKLMSEPTFNPSKQESLDFSSHRYTETPPERALKLLPNLITLNLSYNSIDRFNPNNLLKGAPLLQHLNLSFNKISTLDDIIELGSLKHLRVLNLLKNPISKGLMRIKLIEFLVLPAKYKPYNGVKILTASYEYVPDKSKVTDRQLEELKKFHRMLERSPMEIDYKEFQSTRAQDNLDHLNLRTCPVPRKTRFPMLETFNEEPITIQNMQSILATEDISEILPSHEEVETARRRLVRENEKLHEEYIRKYIKRQRHKEELAGKNMAAMFEKAETAADELKMIFKKDQVEYQKLVSGSAVDKLWQVPADVLYKDAQFNISIEDYKKMIEDYENYKRKLKKDKARKRMIYIKKIRARSHKYRKNRKNEEIGFGEFDEVDEEEASGEDSVESDPEIKKVFGKKPKRKQKFNLDIEKDCTPLHSEDSSLEENEEDLGTRALLANFFMTQEKQGKTEEVSTRLTPRLTSMTSRSKKDKEIKGTEIKDTRQKVTESNEESREITQEEELSERLKEVHLAFQAEKEEKKVAPVYVRHQQQQQESKQKKIFAGILKQTNPQKVTKTYYLKRESKPNLSLPMFGRREIKSNCGSIIELTKEMEKGEEAQSQKDMKTRHVSSYEESTRNDMEEARKTAEESETVKKGDREGIQLYRQSPQERLSSMLKEEKDTANSDFRTPSRFSHNYSGPFGSIIEPSRETDESELERMNQQRNEGAEYYSTPHKISLPMSPPESLGVAFAEGEMSPEKLNENFDEEGPSLIKEESQPEESSITQAGGSSRQKVQSVRTYGTKRNVQSGKKDATTLVTEAQNVVLAANFPAGTGGTTRGTSKEIALRQQAQRIRQQERNSFKISNKIFFNHYKTSPKPATTVPKKPLTHRPTKQKSETVGGRGGSIQWTEWSPRKSVELPPPVPGLSQTPRVQSLNLFINTLQPVSEKARRSSVVGSQVLRPEGGNTTETRRPEESTGKGVSIVSEQGKMQQQTKVVKEGRQGVKIVIKEPLVVTQTLPSHRKVNIESLLPYPKDGGSEKVKELCLGDKEKHARLKETAKLLDETSLVIQQAQEIAEKIQVGSQQYKGGMYPDKVINFEQLAEFMRQHERKDKLTFEDNNDLRELIYLVNDFDHRGEAKMTRLTVEKKLRELKQKILSVDGKTLEEVHREMMKLTQYLEILENIDAIKNSAKSSKQLERMQMKEIEDAENNAVLAAHYTKLKKYYGESHVSKYLEKYSEVLWGLGSNQADGFDIEFAHKVRKTPPSEIRAQITGHQRAESMGSSLKAVPEEGERKEEEVAWYNYTKVEKYVPKVMHTFEELTELSMRKKHEEMSKAGQRVLNMEEQMMKYVEDLKENARNKKELKAKIDKHIRNGRKDIDEFLESQRVENMKVHDKMYCFREYVRLMWENKI